MVDLQELSDDYLMDLEDHAKSTVQMWHSIDKDIRAIALLEENDMYKAYEFALNVLKEIEIRIDVEAQEIFQCQ